MTVLVGISERVIVFLSYIICCVAYSMFVPDLSLTHQICCVPLKDINYGATTFNANSIRLNFEIKSQVVKLFANTFIVFKQEQPKNKENKTITPVAM